MLVIQWSLLASFAFLLTLVWGYADRANGVYVSAGLATVGWSAAALAAPGLQVASGGQLLDAGSTTLSFISVMFAGLSALAVVGYRTGHYPPQPSEETKITDPSSKP
jgi:hypothetical protein